MEKVHLDTDLGGDIDDLCALAMLLRLPNLELTGITTVAESAGRRAGYVRYVLGLAGRPDIPVAAGADVGQGFFRYHELAYPDEARYWPEPVSPSPNPLEEALRLLKHSIEQGSILIAIGPFTNLWLLELRHPGILREARLYLMGGYVFPPVRGFPDLGNESDWNIQMDARAAQHVIQASDPTLIPITITVQTALRREHLHALRNADPLGRLVARQAQAFAEDEVMDQKYGKAYEHVPADIINFLHDPLACAIALGWKQDVETQEIALHIEVENGWLREQAERTARRVRLVTSVKGAAFDAFWLTTLTSEIPI
jgi:inosine-uridine nucleoside N-ribohydrolase